MRNRFIVFWEDASVYILQKEFPHYIGRLTNKLERGLAQYPIAGHSLYVSFFGTLRGNYVPSTSLSSEETNMIFSDMADFALENLIKKTDDYEKYKIRNADKQYNSQGQD